MSRLKFMGCNALDGMGWSVVEGAFQLELSIYMRWFRFAELLLWWGCVTWFFGYTENTSRHNEYADNG